MDDDSQHFMQCGQCGGMFDMRDLGQVMEHEHKGLPPVSNTTGVRIDDALSDKVN